MSFRLVPKLVTLNDLERNNGIISANSGSFRGTLGKSSRSLSHLLMSSCLSLAVVSFLSVSLNPAQVERS